MKSRLITGMIFCTLMVQAAHAQIAATGRGADPKLIARFNNTEPVYQQTLQDLQLLEKQRKDLLNMLQVYNDQQKKLADKVALLEKCYDSASAGFLGSGSGALPESTSGNNPGGISAAGSTPIGAAAGGGGQDQLLNATKQMQETQMLFNLQYLQLQRQMQNENRSYTAVSNIMKTKHDTVKNSISDVR